MMAQVVISETAAQAVSRPLITASFQRLNRRFLKAACTLPLCSGSLAIDTSLTLSH